MGTKRLMDIVFSCFAICVFIVPMIIIGGIIKITSPGPVLFKQKRAGMKGTYFEIYKYRTMRTDTPNVSTESLGNPSQYITPFGRLLRKTSLDELPQLFNIIKGDMSIVGPRPALFNQYELIKMRDELGVNNIRPGLTGYAQVMGRDFISDEEKVLYDAQYVNQMSIFFDMKIIWQTFFSVLKSDGVRLK